MSAVTQNFVYNVGKKQEGKQEHTLSLEKLQEIRKSVAEYLSKKK